MNINFWWAPVRGQTGGRPNFIDTRYMSKECHLCSRAYREGEAINIIRIELFAEDNEKNISQVKFERDGNISAMPFNGTLRVGERQWIM